MKTLDFLKPLQIIVLLLPLVLFPFLDNNSKLLTYVNSPAFLITLSALGLALILYIINKRIKNKEEKKNIESILYLFVGIALLVIGVISIFNNFKLVNYYFSIVLLSIFPYIYLSTFEEIKNFNTYEDKIKKLHSNNQGLKENNKTLTNRVKELEDNLRKVKKCDENKCEKHIELERLIVELRK